MIQVIVNKGSEMVGEPKTFSDDTEIIGIGRGSLNDIKLSDPAVSKFHAAIVKNVHGQYFVRDLSSKNGTKVNGIQVFRHLLNDDDRIQIGEFVLAFKKSVENRKIGIRYLSEKEEKEWLKERFKIDGAESIPTMLESTYEPPLELQGIQLPATQKMLLEDIYKLIKSLPDLQQLLNEIMDMVFDILEPQRGYILCRSDDGELVPTVIRGFDNELTIPLFNSMRKIVLTEGRLFCSSMDLAIPLKREKDVFGLLYLEKEKGFSDGEVSIMELLADYFAEHSTDLKQRAVHGNEYMPADAYDWKSAMVGNKETLIDALNKIYAAARTNEPVLLLGETSTGKEMATLAIHKNSHRKNKPYEAINLADISATLAESELFGHEAGAFTDAKRLKKGKIEIADGGTVLLDEIGDLPMSVQGRLLRFIREGEFTRIGGVDKIKPDVKIIAATNKNLKDGIKEKWFREDLYYRLIRGGIIEVPPLRDRKEDIPLLAHYFIDKYSKKYSAKTEGIAHSAMKMLFNYDWPGNVGELENYIATAISRNRDRLILLSDDFPPEIRKTPMVEEKNIGSKKIKPLEETERDEILNALKVTNWNKDEAATRLGISRAGLYNKIKKYGLEAPMKSKGNR